MDLVGQHLLQREAGQHHLRHLVPGFVHAPAVDAVQGQTLEDHLVPVDAGAVGQDAEQGDLAAVVHAIEHVVEGSRMAGHFERDVEALHVQVAHHVLHRLLRDVHHPRGAHVGGELQAIVVDVGDHHVARADVLADTGGDDADGAGAGDQHVFADDVELQRTVRGVAVGIEEGGQLAGNLVGNRPQVAGRHGHVFGEGAVAVDADADRVRAQVLATGTAVSAMAADDMAFGGDAITNAVAGDGRTQLDDAANKLVADDQPRLDRPLAPLIPLVDVQVGAADRGLFQLDQHLVGADLRHRYGFHPDTGTGFALDQRLHHLGHGPDSLR